jgi:hypothetical protein
MYDEFVVNDNTNCDLGTLNGEGISFFGPLSTYSCTDLHTIALSCGSVSAVSAIDGGSFKNHPGSSQDLVKNYFSETTVEFYTIDSTQIYSNITTAYESASLNQPTATRFQLFEQQYEEYGEIFVRNIHSQEVLTLKESMSAVFNKHGAATKGRIYTSNKIQDFDIIEDSIYIQTNVETITEKYSFKDGTFKNDAGSKSIIT